MLTCEEPSEVVRSLDDGPVSGDVAHGGEGVEDLRAGDPGHAVHAERGQVPLGEGLDQLGVLEGRQTWRDTGNEGTKVLERREEKELPFIEK